MQGHGTMHQVLALSDWMARLRPLPQRVSVILACHTLEDSHGGFATQGRSWSGT